ncbi:hypothetical protein MSAN_01017100 [Mycena sanguinolenta]|uniref:Uncharacterized protein n=1 Tax=Mycena sanguinolenta TaxID=230812 RepID=A0A8H6YR27_9AGAR|nr:hypothetical protein MSAN_01017100 [Mycena sanguinolenta]
MSGKDNLLARDTGLKLWRPQETMFNPRDPGGTWDPMSGQNNLLARDAGLKPWRQQETMFNCRNLGAMLAPMTQKNNPLAKDAGLKPWRQQETMFDLRNLGATLAPMARKNNPHARDGGLKLWRPQETRFNRREPHWVEAMIKASESDATAKMNKKQDKNVHDKENCRPLSETDPPQRQLRSALEQVHCTLPAPPPKRKSRWDVYVKAPKTSERQDSSSTPSTATTTIRKDNALHLGKASANSNSVLRPTSRQPASQTPHQSIPSAPTVSRRETTSEREPLRSINTGATASLAFPPLDHDEPRMRAGTCTPMEISPP